MSDGTEEMWSTARTLVETDDRSDIAAAAAPAGSVAGWSYPVRLPEIIAEARRSSAGIADLRAALCRWEDDLFSEFPAGHELIDRDEAEAVIAAIFRAVGRPVPTLRLVPGFDDPRIGGFADVANHLIAIETGFLYRFLVLHECAHLLVPEDRLHGGTFLYVLTYLYQHFIGIPEMPARRLLQTHGLPIPRFSAAARAIDDARAAA
jgi:hypothetical protein